MAADDREQFIMTDNVKTIEKILDNAGKTFTQIISADKKIFKVYDVKIVIEGESMRLVGEGIDIPDSSKTFWKRFYQLLDIK